MWNLFFKTYSFNEAIKALKEGKKVRRKEGKKGYTAVGGRYVTYWLDDRRIFEYCLFTLEDVFADDWIIET
jgi:hypothetical protein